MKKDKMKPAGMGMGKSKGGMTGKKEAGFSSRVGKGSKGFGKDVGSPAKD